MKTPIIPALMLACVLGTATSAHATTAIGLIGDKTLAIMDSKTATVTGTVEVKGVDTLLGIDLRPNTGQLIGVTADHTIVEINPETGEAKKLSVMDKKLPIKAGQAVIVDFNPKADKMRFMTGTTNHRVDVESGKVTVDGNLAYDKTDMHSGEAPAIAAAAYSNSFGKPEKTAMYDIDATIVALIQQTSPNDGTLAAVGKLGIDGAQTYAFDVATNESGENQAWLVAGGSLHAVSLKTGKVDKSWSIKNASGEMRDITFMTAK